jgi:hypothetical protein
MSTNNKITRARISPEVKAQVLTALQNRTEDSTLASIAASFKVSTGAVAVIARQNNLTKVRLPKSAE